MHISVSHQSIRAQAFFYFPGIPRFGASVRSGGHLAGVTAPILVVSRQSPGVGVIVLKKLRCVTPNTGISSEIINSLVIRPVSWPFGGVCIGLFYAGSLQKFSFCSLCKDLVFAV